MKFAAHCICWLIVASLAVSLADAQSPLVPLSVSSGPSSTGEEDFSSASLAGSQLYSDPAELVESIEEPGYVREWIAVQWRPKDLIYLFVVRPTKVKNPPVAIYLYSFPSETEIFRDQDWCERVTADGYAAVGFVPAFTGHRYHDLSVKEWFVSELQESLARSAHDVQMVLNYLATRGDLDMDRVGIFGEGAGGTVAIMAASVDSRIKAVDLLNPWGDWPVWMAKSKVVPDEERATYLKPEFLKKVAGFDPVALLPKLKTPHIQLIQTKDDFAGTPDESKKKIEAGLPTHSEHRRLASAKILDRVASADAHVSDWLKKQLKSAP